MRATGTPDGSSARKVRAVIEPCGPPVLPGAPSGPPMARRPERPDGQGRGLPEGARIRGLGLVEGLVGLLVLGVLGLLVWGPAHRGRTARGVHLCRVHLLQLHVSLEMYTQDSGGRCPAVAKASTSEATLALLRSVYLSDTRRFVCPRTRDQPPPATNLAQGQVSCAYCQGRNTLAPAAALLLSDEQVNIRDKEPDDLVFSSDGRAPGNNHGSAGGNVLLRDGPVRFRAARAAFALRRETVGVQLLNPRP